MAEFDACVFTAAEYNRGPTAVLKNALDYVGDRLPLPQVLSDASRGSNDRPSRSPQRRRNSRSWTTQIEG